MSTNEPRGGSAPPHIVQFALDRQRLEELFEATYGELCGLEWSHEDGPAGSLSERVYDARDAISGPEDTEIEIYPVHGDSLLICVCERNAPAWRPPRQVATYLIEMKRLACADPSVEELCEALDKVLLYANGLLPSLRAMQAGERMSSPGEHRLPDVTVYHGSDGAAVVEVDTEPMGEALHCEDGAPWLRVYVNDARVSDDSPARPLPGSRLARGEEDPDPAAPIGRLIVERAAKANQ